MQSFSGRADASLTSLLGYAGNLVGTPIRACLEYTDNSRDAGARNIMFELRSDRVVIFDDGHGMVPKMSLEDYQLLQEYKAEIEEGRGVDYDVRDILDNPSSGKSFVWLMECIAFSIKRPKADDKVTGMRGIGMLAFRLIGETPIWYSKPASEVAQHCYEGKDATDPPIAMLHAPTATDLDRSRLGYNVEFPKERALRDPLGKIHPHGTRIEIIGLKRGLEQSLRPTVLVDELRKRYGVDITSGRLNIVVIDKMTVEGKVTPNGRLLEVPGVSYGGSNIFSGTFQAGGASFSAELYYEVGAKKNEVTLRRKGVDVAPITVIEELRGEPWNMGALSGFIEFVNLPEDEAPWTPDKTAPLSSPVRTEWVRRIASWHKQIAKAIDDIESRIRDARTKSAFDLVSESAMRALGDIPVLRDLADFGLNRSTNPTNPNPGPRSKVEIVIATVFDEYNRGVPDITVELVSDGKPTRGVTGRGGSYSFGKVLPGRHTIRILVPEAMDIADGIDSWSPTLTPTTPGFRAVFHLVTGKIRDLPKRTKLRHEIKILPRQLHDPSQPYSSAKLGSGIIEVNTEFDAFKIAIERGDDKLRDTLAASFAAAAIVEYTMKEFTAQEQIMMTVLLQSKIFSLWVQEAPKPTRKRSS